MLTVAIDATPAARPGTGIHRATVGLLKGLAELGGDLTYTGIVRWALGPRRIRLPGGMAVTRVRLPRSCEGWMRAARWMERRARASLYHATDFYLPLGPEARSVCTVHDVLFLTDPDPRSVDHDRLRRWAPDYIRRAAAILTPSSFSRDEIVRQLGIPPNRVSVTPWGVGEEWCAPVGDVLRRLGRQPPEAPSRPYFVTASCSTGRKNTLSILRAHRIALDRGLQADLTVVWQAPDEVRREYACSAVRFLPWQSNEQLRDLMASSLAFVWMTKAEGFGFPVLEAMASATPVVCSDLPVLKEVADDVASYVSPEDVEGLATRLLALADAPSVRASMAERGRERALGFTWRRCAERTVQVYRSALAYELG